MAPENKIKSFIINNIPNHPHDITSYAMAQLHVSRTTVRRHLTYLIKAGLVYKNGTTKNSTYYIKETFDKKVTIALPSEQGEFEIFKEHFEGICQNLPENVYDIILYGLTEIINNAFDHAKGRKLDIEVHKKDLYLVFTITDDGIGIFKKIAQFAHFSDIRESILQLNKGKFTTDNKNHSGEGIFFTSRIFDNFKLSSNGIEYIRNNLEQDWSIQSLKNNTPGTAVTLSIRENAPQSLTPLFLKFQNPETLAFDKTEITVELSRFGEETFVSRSQAKRVLKNLEPFRSITLDFKDVRMVGQGFVDEVFRVYLAGHPDKIIQPINANKDVLFMIQRTLATPLA